MTTLTLKTETEKHNILKKVVKNTAVVSALAAAAFAPEILVAAGGAAPSSPAAAIFTDLADFLWDALGGTLGTVVIVSMIIVGVVGGIVNQSLMAFAVGIGGAIGLTYLKAIVTNVQNAAFEMGIDPSTVTDALQALSNGM